MGLQKAVIVAALGALGYLYLEEDAKSQQPQLDASGNEIIDTTTCGPIMKLVTDASGVKFCKPKLECRKNFLLSPDMTQCFDPKDGPCGPGFKMDDKDECQIQDSVCGDTCYRLNPAKTDCVKIPNCGSISGNDYGDMAIYFGESIILGVIYDAIGRRVGTVLERQAARITERRIALEVSKKAAAEATKQLAKRAATAGATRLASQVAARTLAPRATAILAKRLGINVGLKIVKKLAAKLVIQMAKMAAMNSSIVGALATPLMALSISLSIGMTAAGVFWEVPQGEGTTWDFNQLPEALQAAITAIPVWGDILDIVTSMVYFSTSCDKSQEEQNGLCYAPPDKDFQCEAFLCPALPQALPGYRPENFIGSTKFHLTKKVITDTPTVPNICPANMEHSEGAPGGFCYEKQSQPGHNVLGIFWEDCPAGYRTDGALCGREEMDPCPAGSDDVAGTCWGNVGQVCADNCGAGWDDCKRKSWNALKCKRGSDKCSWGCYQDNPFGRCGGCEKRSWSCDEYGDWDCIGGCRTTCSPTRGITKELIHRNLQIKTFARGSRVLAPHGNLCPPGRSEKIADLCYPNQSEMPTGYRRKTVGLLEPECPGEKSEWFGFESYQHIQDIGVSCQLPTYTRKPWPKVNMRPKRRVTIADTPDPPLPPLCSALPELPETDANYHQRLCREKDPPSGYALSGDGLTFHKVCRALFTFDFSTTNCSRVDDAGNDESYPNAEGLLQVDYDFK